MSRANPAYKGPPLEELVRELQDERANLLGSSSTVEQAVLSGTVEGSNPSSPAKLQQRVKNKVSVSSSGCWEWQGAKFPNGYGALKVNGKVIGAHRIAYEAFVGEIPRGLFILHSCDNPPCCNPEHLSIGDTPTQGLQPLLTDDPVNSC